MANLSQTVGEILGETRATAKNVDEIKLTLHNIESRLVAIEMREAQSRARITTVSAIVGASVSFLVARWDVVVGMIKNV